MTLKGMALTARSLRCAEPAEAIDFIRVSFSSEVCQNYLKKLKCNLFKS